MKKLILSTLFVLGLIAAGAVYTAPANAVTPTGSASFTAIQPAGTFSQWTNVWTHVYKITVSADGTFTGTGVENGNDGSTTMVDVPETITGTLNGDGTMSFVSTRTGDGVQWSLTDAVTDFTTVNIGRLLNPDDPSYLLEFKVSAPVFDVVPPAAVLNHGDCVSGAAHAGVKGTNLAAIAKVVTLVGNYGSSTCPAVIG